MNIPRLQQLKESGEKFIMSTAYDYTQARLADEAGCELIMAGDSLGKLSQGYDDNNLVSIDEAVYHTAAVSRGVKHGMVVGDMPFGSYHVSVEKTAENAIRLIREGRCHMVKLEGGREITPIVSELNRRGIPVMGHIGMLPQMTRISGMDTVCGCDEDSAWELVETAQDFEEAGACCLIVECVTAEVLKLITSRVDIPVIGMGSGPDCDGQALIFHDVTGLTDESPAYARRFAEAGEVIRQAFRDFHTAVQGQLFPAPEHAVRMPEDEAKRLY